MPREATKDERKHRNNKRIHGLNHVWKDIFETLMYYKCGFFVMEDLNFKTNNDLGNKEANRKCKNLWHRELSDKRIQKYINKLGINKIEVNPIYTSFIGNINYKYLDPTNAAIEIGRRGLFQYGGGAIYPEFRIDIILNTMTQRNKISFGDVSKLKAAENWVSAYKIIKKSGLRYRATKDDCTNDYQVVDNIIHSLIEKVIYN